MNEIKIINKGLLTVNQVVIGDASSDSIRTLGSEKSPILADFKNVKC